MNTQIESLQSDKKNVAVQEENYVDKLDREKLAKNFVSVLTSQNANVFSINGGWGSGKTWFLKFVEKECNEQKIPFLQYNVWETDYLDDPLRSIVSEMIDKLNLLNDAKLYFDGTKFETIQKEIVDLKKSSLNLFKFFKQFKLTPEMTYQNAEGSAISVGIGIEPKVLEEDDYDKMKRLKDDFIFQLKKVLLELHPNEIVIAIDELDRCRPDYAIRTLEIIKHFFNIKGIKFILSVDKEQLARTVKTMFGQDADADCYLRKFVDVEYNLPEPIKTEFINYLFKQKYPIIEQKLMTFSKNKKLLYKGIAWGKKDVWLSETDSRTLDIAFAENAIRNVLIKSKLCLREIEKCLLRLNIVIKELSEEKDFLEVGFLLNLIIINLKDPQDFINLSKFGATDNPLKISENFGMINHFIKLKTLGERCEPSEEYDIIARCATLLYKYYGLINLSEGFE